jgi:anthranilate phosphoribosyltransferase
VAHGADGLDEISTVDKTYISEFTGGAVRSYEIIPEEFGFKRSPEKALMGGDKDLNATLIRRTLAGERGPRRSIVVLNAAFALYAAGKAASPEDGVVLASESIDSGRARDVLERLKEFTNRGE